MNGKNIGTSAALLALAALAGCAAPDQTAWPRTGWFFVGGQYVESKAGPLMEILRGKFVFKQWHCPSCGVSLKAGMVDGESAEGS